MEIPLVPEWWNLWSVRVYLLKILCLCLNMTRLSSLDLWTALRATIRLPKSRSVRVAWGSSSSLGIVYILSWKWLLRDCFPAGNFLAPATATNCSFYSKIPLETLDCECEDARIISAIALDAAYFDSHKLEWLFRFHICESVVDFEPLPSTTLYPLARINQWHPFVHWKPVCQRQVPVDNDMADERPVVRVEEYIISFFSIA